MQMKLIFCGNFFSVGKYQVVYFPIRGRAEAIRLLLIDRDEEFEDVDCKENWATEWKPKQVFGQTPQLVDGDFCLNQTNAILRYLARKHDLYGQDLKESAKIDMVNDGVEDMRQKYTAMIYRNYENGKDDFIKSLPAQLEYFEKFLAAESAAKTGFTIGGKASYVDYSLFDILDAFLTLSPTCLDAFPTLSTLYKSIEARPNIAKYRQTDLCKSRKFNGNGKQ